MSCNGSTMAPNARDVGSILSLGTIFPHFYHTHDTGCHDHDPVQAACCMVIEPTLCMYISKVIACMYEIVNSNRLTISGGQV